jgi:hypothetical protein
MGRHLEELHPGDVVSFGLFTQWGEYAAAGTSGMTTYTMFPGPLGSIEYLLHRSGHPILALNLRPSGT